MQEPRHLHVPQQTKSPLETLFLRLKQIVKGFQKGFERLLKSGWFISGFFDFSDFFFRGLFIKIDIKRRSKRPEI